MFDEPAELCRSKPVNNKFNDSRRHTMRPTSAARGTSKTATKEPDERDTSKTIRKKTVKPKKPKQPKPCLLAGALQEPLPNTPHLRAILAALPVTRYLACEALKRLAEGAINQAKFAAKAEPYLLEYLKREEQSPCQQKENLA
jgi:hypothetical protein